MWHSKAWSARNGRKTKDVDYIKIEHDQYGEARLIICGDQKNIVLALAVCAARNPTLQIIIQQALHKALKKVETDREAREFLKEITKDLNQ